MATPEATGPGGQEELMKQLRTFLQGASGGGRGTANTRMAATALHLLTHLPAAREVGRAIFLAGNQLYELQCQGIG